LRKARFRILLLHARYVTARICRVSTQTTGKLASPSALNSHCDSRPASIPIRAAHADLVSPSASLRALVPDKIQPSAADDRGDGTDNAANGVGDVVVGAGRMVDAIPPITRCAALEGRQLAGELRMVDQVDQLRIHQRKQNAIQIALRLRRRLIGDAVALM
jgi:hypothetical protein